MALQVNVACAAADLRGKIVRIMAQDGVVVKEAELTTFDETVNQTDEFVVTSPAEPGDYTWTALFPAQEDEGNDYQESSTTFSFCVKPHTTSLAVWGITSPVIVDSAFRLKVGVKCSAVCNLAGEQITVHDQTGAQVATGTLGDALYSDTIDLYWTEVELTAPVTPGTYTWEVKLPNPGLELPHAGASLKFGFSVTKQPKYKVTIEVVHQNTKAPVANAHVMLRPYSGYTDDKGVTELTAADGEYKLHVTKGEYESFQTTVNVTGDAAIQAALTPARFREDYRGNLWKVEKK
jgi:hypothetical protein